MRFVVNVPHDQKVLLFNKRNIVAVKASSVHPLLAQAYMLISYRIYTPRLRLIIALSKPIKDGRVVADSREQRSVGAVIDGEQRRILGIATG